jgi:hypothetical protein
MKSFVAALVVCGLAAFTASLVLNDFQRSVSAQFASSGVRLGSDG